MQIEQRFTESLVPYERNARTHSDEQIKQICRSINEFGFINPVLVDENDTIIAGHGRVEAAKKIMMAEVPVIVLKGLTDEQRRAYVIADNRLAMNAGWDVELLKFEVDELLAGGFDVDLLGFTGKEMSDLLRVDRPEADDVPDEAPPVAQTGDLWALGEHRLLCGDATSEADVSRLLGDAVPHLMVTDPPYGVNYDPNQRRLVDNGKTRRSYMESEHDTNVEWSEAWQLFTGNVAYVWHSDKQLIGVGLALESCGFALRQNIIWVKNSLTVTRTQYNYQHEHCWYAVRKKSHWVGPANETTTWKIDKVNADTGHGAQKPIACMQRPIENNSRRGDAVYDPFLGSGTTLIAAEQTGRICYGLELNPTYCDIIIARWEAFTGEKAVKLKPNGKQ